MGHEKFNLWKGCQFVEAGIQISSQLYPEYGYSHFECPSRITSGAMSLWPNARFLRELGLCPNRMYAVAPNQCDVLLTACATFNVFKWLPRALCAGKSILINPQLNKGK